MPQDHPLPDPPARHFVRTILGCGCPEEVLARIAIRTQPGPPPWLAMDVGGRLLVHVRRLADGIPSTLEDWLAAGVGERDAAGFHRFRLVLVCVAPAAIRPEAEARLDSWGGDDRAHLHVVSEAEAAGILGITP